MCGGASPLRRSSSSLAARLKLPSLLFLIDANPDPSGFDSSITTSSAALGVQFSCLVNLNANFLSTLATPEECSREMQASCVWQEQHLPPIMSLLGSSPLCSSRFFFFFLTSGKEYKFCTPFRTSSSSLPNAAPGMSSLMTVRLQETSRGEEEKEEAWGRQIFRVDEENWPFRAASFFIDANSRYLQNTSLQ